MNLITAFCAGVIVCRFLERLLDGLQRRVEQLQAARGGHLRGTLEGELYRRGVYEPQQRTLAVEAAFNYSQLSGPNRWRLRCLLGRFDRATAASEPEEASP